ncbi:MAG TPA: hypothetical protein VK524_25200, partial [Polyangiaceae bacterium]|nr:hypothetical protein [Polyangiaceae bacterium]
MSDAVKLRDAPGVPRHPCLTAALLASFSGVLLLFGVLYARPASAQLLELPRAAPPPAPLDPRLPTGAFRAASPRPRVRGAPACSFHRPVCIQAESSVPSELTLALLGALERAYETLILVLRQPAPWPDRDLGGSSALDLYVTQEKNGSPPELLALHDEPLLSAFDEAPGYCVLNLAESVTPEQLERWAALCVGELSLLRVDAGETPHTRRALANHYWQLLGRPTVDDFRIIDDAQAHPERALARRDVDASSAGAALVFEYLEQLRSNAGPGVLSTSLVALAASKTSTAQPLWNNEPDWLDVLRASFREDRPSIAGAWADFAVSRAFLGSRDDGRHLPSLTWLGDFGRVRFDWVLKYSSLPRRVPATRPIEPSGSIYLWLALDELALGAVVGFQATWEPPVAFKWSLVRVDKD